MDFTRLGRGAAIDGPGRAYAHPLGRLAHALWSKAQPIRMSSSPQKSFITDRNTPQFHLLSGWLVSDNPAGKEAGCGGPGLVWLSVRPVEHTAKFSKTTL